MAKYKKHGFTLVELIVVIAIIGVLAAFLVPSLMGYVKKSKKSTDVTSAKTIYDTVMAVLADNEDTIDSFTANNSTFEVRKGGNDPVTGKPKGYTLNVVCTKDGSGNHSQWSGGSAEAEKFEDALNAMFGKGKTPIKYNRSDSGKSLDRWFICYRNGEAVNAEVWVGDGSSNTPVYRLWPYTDPDYS